MSELSDKAKDVAQAKQAADDLTGNHDLKAEGAADGAHAQVKQGAHAVAEKAHGAFDTITDAASAGADAVAEKAGEVKDAVADTADDFSQHASELKEKAAYTAHDLHLDDRRVQQFAAIAVAANLLILGIRRRAVGTRTASTAKGVSRALTR